MAASVPSSPSPASLTFPPLIHEPVKPNPHPYAIRTTSTGVLSRSNSSGRNIAASRHHYVPLAPNSTKREARGHRSVKSTSSVANVDPPQPLPVPPESVSAAKYHHRTRADTLPSILTDNEPLDVSLASVALPANPKLWTVSQLSSYLLRTLRMPSQFSDLDEDLPLAVVQDVAMAVKEAKINGRAFLRLNEEDLDSIGINQRWREVLLHASRVLRQSAIKAQIWGPHSDSSPPSGSASPALPSHPFTNSQFNSSSSSVDLSSDEGLPDASRRRRHRGRVLGMVESFERSGSFSSESSCDEGSPGDRELAENWLQEQAHIPVETQVVISPTSEAPPDAMCKGAVCAAEPEEPSIEALLAHNAEEDAGADADRSFAWGARAWEDLDIAPGVTVKHIPDQVATASPSEPAHTARQEHPEESTDALSGTGGSAKANTRGRARDERRVVTAIFAPRTLAKPTAENQQHPAADVEGPGPAASNEQAIQTTSEAGAEEGVREDLLAELAATRALVEGLRVRLEGVEQKLSVLQDIEAHRETRRYEERGVDVHFPAEGRETNALQGVEPSMDAQPLSTDPEEAIQDPAASEPRSVGLPSSAAASQTYASTVSSIIHTSAERKLNEVPETPEQRSHGEPTLSDLPQYVFLVGFGVCAVVLQVVLRKFVGRSPGFGWK